MVARRADPRHPATRRPRGRSTSWTSSSATVTGAGRARARCHATGGVVGHGVSVRVAGRDRRPGSAGGGFVIEPETAWEDGESHFTRHVYRVGDAIKALILMEGASTDGGPGRWNVTAWQACRASEFDSADGRTTDDAPWSDATGQATEEVHTITGPGHCGWQSTVWLHRGDALYIRDPGGIFATRTVRPYAEPGALPSSAVDTGLHSVRWRLFAGPSPRVAWMVRPDGGVEAWPRAKDPEMGCA